MKYVILILVLLIAAQGNAQPGNIDKSFGHGNGTLLNFGKWDYGKSILQLPNDKFIVVGITAIEDITQVNISQIDYGNVVLACFNNDGEIDRTFGNDGKIITDLIAFNKRLGCSLVTKDGKLLFIGTDANKKNVILKQYLTNGKLDSSFGKTGVVTTNYNQYFDRFYSMVFQTDGKILAGGTTGDVNIPGTNKFAIVRFLSDGRIDSSFGIYGMVKDSINPSADSWLNTIALQQDGKILGIGGSFDSISTVNIIRYNANGTRDTTFGNNGLAKKILGAELNAVAIQNDGKILCAGTYDPDANAKFLLLRYTSLGQIDSSFGKNGMTITSTTGEDHLQSLILLPNGKIIGSGYHSVSFSNYDFALAGYSSDGKLDPSFGINGKTTTDIAGGDDFGLASGFLSNSTIVLIGYSYNGNNFDIGITGYYSNGALNHSFGNATKFLTSKLTGNDEATSLSIKSDDHILLTGKSDKLQSGFLGGITYDKSGMLSKNGQNDRLFLHENLNLNASVLWNDNLIMRGGQFYNTNTNIVDFALLFQDYLSSSYKFITFGFGGHSLAQSLLAQGDNIVVSGYAFTGKNYDFALVKYNFNIGNLAPTFGTNGKVTTDLSNNQDYAYASALQTDEKIILAGTSFNDKQWRIALVRYNTDGSLDNTFGSSGIVFTAIHDSDDCAKSFQVQKDGKIVVAGYTLDHPGGFYHAALVRYTKNGTLDSTFGTNGITELALGAGDAKANGMVIQPDGKIVIAGYTSNGRDDDFLVACYNTDGRLDKNFGNSGLTITDFQSGNDRCNAVALQSDGAIVAAGYAFNGTDRDYAVTRYIPDLSLGVIDKSTSEKSIIIYPNPIHDKTKVNYELSESEHVTIKLYDILGNERAIFLNNQMRNKGKNTEDITLPNNLAAGSYILMIETERGKASVKVVKE